MEKEKITIITPVYNCEKFLKETIECVINQTYQNWELLLVDDSSKDKSLKIIEEYAKKDNRIKFFKTSKNEGTAIARNIALKEAHGRFIAYLDSDDLWKVNKLENQISFMMKNNYAFTCTDYEKIDEKGKLLKKIKLPQKINYNSFLKNTIIQTVGVMVDVQKTGKEILSMPNYRRRQDAITWSRLLKNGFNCYEVPEYLSYYRVVHNSLSSNKFEAIKMNWYWYRKIENLSFFEALYCFLGYAINGIRKRIYIKRKIG